MGLAIVSSPRLESAFTAYRDGHMKNSEVLDSLQDQAGDVEYEWLSRTPSRRSKRIQNKKSR